MNFFADFLILFGRFSENPRKCPFFRHFFASPCRSSGAFSAHILLQSLLRDHAEAQKGGFAHGRSHRPALHCRGALHAPPPDDHPADCRRVPALQIRHPQRHAPAPSAGGCSPRPRGIGAAGVQQVRPPFARRRGDTAALCTGKKPKICGVLAIS